MLDLNSYRNAMNVLDEKNGAVPVPHPRPTGTHRPFSTARDRSHVDNDDSWDYVPNGSGGGGHNRWESVPADRRHRITSSQTNLSNGKGNRSRNVSRTVYNDDRDEERASTSRLMNSGRQDDKFSRSRSTSSFPVSMQEYNNGGGRSSTSRLVYDGELDARNHERSAGIHQRKTAAGEKQFLSEVQKELENQRLNWKDEIERMTGSMLLNCASNESSNGGMAMKSSYVDTSNGEARFKAYVDVSEFPPSSVTVNVDKLSNKVVVEARQVNHGSVAKTFTQKVPMPRFADDTRLTARMNRRGILKIEVPLIYYFPEEEENARKTKSFVYEVRTNRDGSKTMEILVKPGNDISIRDLRVEVGDDDKLVVFADKPTTSRLPAERIVVKKYTLPANAAPDRITSSRTSDGCLSVLVPIYEQL